MDVQQNATTNDTTDNTGPDDSEPTLERQAELRDAYKANVAMGKPPYAGVVIGSRGELNWIITERGWTTAHTAATQEHLPDLRATGITADVRNVNLAGVNLSGARIAGANFSGVDLGPANLSGAFIIEDANFTSADLTTTNLTGAFVIGDFTSADLTGSNLSNALIIANFTGANLTRARMDAGTVFGGYDEQSNLQMDTATRLLDVAWNGAILALVNWDQVPRLGDEAYIKEASTRIARVHAYREAARAYYGLAKALESQGLTSQALRYRRRQHQLERAAQLRSFNLLGWLFSSALNIVSGYGDRPLRALGVYLTVILAFAGVYFGITTPGSPIFFTGSQPLQLHEAVVFSLSSFHGRGFFPSTIGLGDPVAIVAALEAVVGLFIELVLIATFTRRLFER